MKMDFIGNAKEYVVLTIPQMIDLSLGYNHVNFSLLHSLLKIVADKIDLNGTRVLLTSQKFGSLPALSELPPAIYEEFAHYKVLEGGDEDKFRLSKCKFSRMESDDHKPVDTVVKISKVVPKIEGGQRESHRVTFTSMEPMPFTSRNEHHSEEKIEEMASKNSEYFMELMNFSKRLESCEVGIEKLTQVMQNFGCELGKFEMRLNQPPANEQQCAEETLVHEDRGTQTNAVLETLDHEPQDSEEQLGRKDIKNIVQDEIGMEIFELKVALESIPDSITTLDKKVRQMERKMLVLESKVKNMRPSLQHSHDFSLLECKITENREDICKIQKSYAQYLATLESLIESCKRFEKSISELQNRINIASEVDRNSRAIEELQAFKTKIEAEICEAIDDIRVSKSDREEVEYIFKEKADRKDLEKYVTEEYFEKTYNDMQKNVLTSLEQTLGQRLELKRLQSDLGAIIEEKNNKTPKKKIESNVAEKIRKLEERFKALEEEMPPRKASAVRAPALEKFDCLVCCKSATISRNHIPIPRQPPLRLSRDWNGTTLFAFRANINQKLSAIPQEFDPLIPRYGEGDNGTVYRIDNTKVKFPLE